MKLLDKERSNKPVHHATIRVNLDHGGDFDITTDHDGHAKFGTTTSIRHLALQVIDADESVIKPIFELHDDQDYLKEGDVHIDIRERAVSISSCIPFI
jgi:hypothetical protein